MAPHSTPSRGELASAQFDATKHSWRGKYARTIVLGQGHLVTHDPVDRPPNSLGRQTNSWPVTDLGLVDQQGCTVFLKLHTAKHWWQNMLVFHLAREEEATRLIRRLGQVRCSRPHLSSAQPRPQPIVGSHRVAGGGPRAGAVRLAGAGGFQFWP